MTTILTHPKAEVREILDSAASPPGRVKLGSLLADIGMLELLLAPRALDRLFTLAPQQYSEHFG